MFSLLLLVWKVCSLILFFQVYQASGPSHPSVSLDTESLLFSREEIVIAWVVKGTESCLAPLTSTLYRKECHENGQVVSKYNTNSTKVIIQSTDFTEHNFGLSVTDSNNSSCGDLSYLFQVQSSGKNQVLYYHK